MKILVDIGHPAHVHYYRNMTAELTPKGHSVLFTTRDKEVTLELLNFYKIEYKVIGRSYSKLIDKISGLLKSTIRLFLICLQFKPDVLINATPSAAFVSRLLGRHHISLEDTFNMEQVKLYLPFTDVILTGDYPHPDLGVKDLKYPGYHELAYLHPNVYKPDEGVFKSLGLTKNDKYAIVRFVAWNASHDIGHAGISPENKIKLVESLAKYFPVFISSEAELPVELKKYRINIKPEQMHDALNFAHLFIGESATMSSECAMLGTPAVFLDNTGRKYTENQEKQYGLVFNYTESAEDQLKAIDKAIELAESDNIKEQFKIKKDIMLKDKIDVTAFLVWFVENYPASEKEMRESEFSFDRFR